MSTASFELKMSNPYLDGLQSLFPGKRAALQWLVIAHNDPAMVRRVSQVIDDTSVAALQIPQGSWDFNSSDLSQAVEWSVSTAGVKNLVLVGHSKADLLRPSAAWIGGGVGVIDPNRSQRSSDNRLLDRANNVQQQIQQSKDHFSWKVE